VGKKKELIPNITTKILKPMQIVIKKSTEISPNNC
jgi:hypothetical protein